jgi:DNA polymerase
MDEQKYCILDYETRSEADLVKVGGFEYANHPSTQILCASWRVGTREQLGEALRHKIPPRVWSSAFPNLSLISELILILLNPAIKIIAHNAFFEQVISRFVLSKFSLMYGKTLRHTPAHDRWICTAATAAALSLPRSLENACQALKLPIQKDMIGRRLILKYCKPRKASKNNSDKWHSSARDLRRIMEYCQSDVDAETQLFLTLPPLNETERKVWLLDQKINFRGFQVDRELVHAALKLIAEETKNLNAETTEITGGKPGSTTQRDSVLKWLHREGVFLPNLQAKTVEDAIKEGLATGKAKRILEIRQAVSKTSTKKYTAFDTRSHVDGRVRDILMYHAASTGRWGGRGVQPQNFPRGTIANTDLAADILKLGSLEFIRLVYSNPMAVLSSCLRSVIVAPEGRELFCADYAAIEARVLFWVAKHAYGLDGFLKNRPMYEEMASVIYNVEIENVTKPQRQVGKQSFLGCGYGMGWKKFNATCQKFGMEVDEVTAQQAVNAYRSLHKPVVELWTNFELAATEAVRRKGTKFKINRTSWWVEAIPGTHDVLWCELPSGRRLAYLGPEIQFDTTPWGDKRPVLYHLGVNSMTKKWELSGTYGGKLVENVVQAISRDLMADSMLRIDAKGYDLILTVHDEILAERETGKGSLEEFEKLMATTPPWAEGCPIRVEGWKGQRYKK